MMKRPAMIRRGLGPAVACAVCAGAHAGIMDCGFITDQVFFEGFESTLIDFETRGNGTPLALIEGQTLTMPTAEYASFGVTFSPAVQWVNDGTPAFNAAQNLGGTAHHAIPSTSVNTFTMTFAGGVRSVGMWVANNYVTDPDGPLFTARDSDGVVIKQFTFGSQTSGSEFVHGRVLTADYGFFGLFSTVPIATVTITKSAAILDNLVFSEQIPAPGAVGALAVAGLYASRRRRPA